MVVIVVVVIVVVAVIARRVVNHGDCGENMLSASLVKSVES